MTNYSLGDVRADRYDARVRLSFIYVGQDWADTMKSDESIDKVGWVI